MSSIPLEAREILHHLNSLGYRNVTAEQLKEFMKGFNFVRPHNNLTTKYYLQI